MDYLLQEYATLMPHIMGKQYAQNLPCVTPVNFILIGLSE